LIPSVGITFWVLMDTRAGPQMDTGFQPENQFLSYNLVVIYVQSVILVQGLGIFARPLIQVRGLAPIGMVEFWNIGKMGLGLRLVEPPARRAYGSESLRLGEDTAILGKWQNSSWR
jgi:hypothetical protein